MKYLLIAIFASAFFITAFSSGVYNYHVTKDILCPSIAANYFSYINRVSAKIPEGSSSGRWLSFIPYTFKVSSLEITGFKTTNKTKLQYGFENNGSYYSGEELQASANFRWSFRLFNLPIPFPSGSGHAIIGSSSFKISNKASIVNGKIVNIPSFTATWKAQNIVLSGLFSSYSLFNDKAKTIFNELFAKNGADSIKTSFTSFVDRWHKSRDDFSQKKSFPLKNAPDTTFQLIPENLETDKNGAGLTVHTNVILETKKGKVQIKTNATKTTFNPVANRTYTEQTTAPLVAALASLVLKSNNFTWIIDEKSFAKNDLLNLTFASWYNYFPQLEKVYLKTDPLNVICQTLNASANATIVKNEVYLDFPINCTFIAAKNNIHIADSILSIRLTNSVEFANKTLSVKTNNIAVNQLTTKTYPTPTTPNTPNEAAGTLNFNKFLANYKTNQTDILGVKFTINDLKNVAVSVEPDSIIMSGDPIPGKYF